MLGYQQRKMTGWYFETATRVAFPDVTFTGFKEYMDERDDDEDLEA